MEIEKTKMNNAKHYYERQLLIKYGILAFSKVAEEARKKNRLANN